MAVRSAHIDTFAAANLPPPETLPEFIFSRPELQYPARLNCVSELLDRAVAEGDGERTAILAPGLSWSYAELQHKANCVAAVLHEDLNIVPGNRVLLRAANTPMPAKRPCSRRSRTASRRAADGCPTPSWPKVSG